MAVSEAPTEQPILLLGATGFSPAQRDSLQALLARPVLGAPRWQLVPFREADGWWVNGSRSQLQADGTMRVTAGLPSEHALHLDLGGVDRPLAFSEPLSAGDFAPRYTFRLDDDASMRRTLQQFERLLGSLRAQFALGAMVLRRGTSLRQTVHHLNFRGNLLAVLDWRTGQVGMHPNADAADLWQAEWHRRPDVAQALPEGFVGCTPAQLLWAYVRRTDRPLLPERYRTSPIHFRRAPRVPVRWLRDSQLLLLRELTAGPGDFNNLLRRTGLSEAVLAHDLSCLYYVGSVTTTAGRAIAGARAGDDSLGPGDGADGWPQGPALVSSRTHDKTAPALLDPRLPRVREA